ncbi:hypothetical protein ASJ30_10055 [Janibacter indicus]|uniref:DUF2306 domain-containing protein n=1 Tax=Janibacter indicus TaxID=857417 RepID=A0A1L3MHE2_9MICO|nr:DUF2306 domain-containing protein [Janibacter indicus]APH01825.1 hypothetical protein ASJ30_10055 [Janibacter indicus]
MTPLLVSHLVAALVALPLGGYQLFRPTKGDPQHVFLGRVWAGLMLWVAVSSYGIRDLREGQLSLLHILSTVTLVTVTLGIVQARRGNIAAHKGNMRGSWLGMCGAFVGAVAVPDRIIPTFVVTRPLEALVAVLVLALTTVLLIRAGALLTDHHDAPAAG